MPSPTGEPGEESGNCVADIELADFVAVRLDSDAPRALGELDEHYEACASRVRRSEGGLPLRLGVCCARWSPEAGQWELRGHEVGLWPGGNLEMTADVVARRLRAAASAEAAARKGEGPGGARLGSRWVGQLASSAQWVLSAIHKTGVPLLLHDGLPDVLQLFDKFSGEVPARHVDFGRAWIELFPLVFDTLVIAQDGQSDVAPGSSAASLDELHKQSWDQARQGAPPARFREEGLWTHRASSLRLGLAAGIKTGSAARCSMAVAEVFLAQMGSRIRPGERGCHGAAPPAQPVAPAGPPPPPAGAAGSEEKHTASGASGAAAAASGSDAKAAPSSRTTLTPAPSSLELPLATPAKGECVKPPQDCGTPTRAAPSGPLKGPAAGAPSAGFPTPRRKRKWSAASEAAASAAALERLAAKLAAPDEESLERSRAACRRFHNSLASGTPARCLRLDTMIQAHLVKRLRRNQVDAKVDADAWNLARALWARPSEDVKPAPAAAA